MIKRTVNSPASLLAAVLLVATAALGACGSDPSGPDLELAEATAVDNGAAESSATSAEAGETVAVPTDEEPAEAEAEAVAEQPAEAEAVDEEPAEAEAQGPDDGHHGLDLARFMAGALTTAPATVDCTLSGGTETTCLELTIAGFPVDREIGPFCPTTTSATAAEGGIWFDGNNRYDIDGQFILDLAEIYGDDNWKLYDDAGNVNVTETAEAFAAAARPDVDPEYQNHCVMGSIDWLANGEPVQATVQIPASPVLALAPTNVGGSVGITLNGHVIDPAAPVDAILGAYTIAAFDDCGGHINPVAGYHMHGAVGCSEVGDAESGDAAQFAYALDGFPIHSPLDPADVAAANLDECNGHATEASGYHYHANQTEVNAVLSCFMGEYVSTGNERGGGDARGERPDAGAPADGEPAAAGAPVDGAPADGAPPRDGEQGRPAGGGPDFSGAAAALGISEDELLAALGGPPPDFAAAAQTLGVTVEELEAVLPAPGGR